MNWGRLAEHRIEEAMAQGEFDNLPGRGRPLDLSEYFAQPATERVGTNLLKSANVLPPEMEILKRIAALEGALEACQEAGEAGRLRAELQEKRVAYAMTMERRRRRERAV